MNHQGISALHIAAKADHLAVVKLLIQEKGLNINLQERGIWRSSLHTPLHQAVLESRLEVVAFLLSQPECDPSIMDINKEIPLLIAVFKYHSSDTEKILRILLAHPKTDINHGKSAHTPFQKACHSGQLWIVKILAQQKGIQWGHEKEGEETRAQHFLKIKN